MKRLKSPFILSLIIVWCMVGLLTSCSSLNPFKNDAVLDENTDQEQMVHIETQIADMKENQDRLEQQILNKQEIISNLENKVVSLEHKIETLENKKGIKQAADTKKDETEPSQLYKKARNLLLEQKAVEAADLFMEFANKYPENSLADNAMYWLGECHYSLGRYKKAVLVFKDLVKKYPKAEKVPDAILKTGYSYLSLDDSNRAHHYLKMVVKQYPFSQAAEKAQEKLGTFK